MFKVQQIIALDLYNTNKNWSNLCWFCYEVAVYSKLS